MLDLSPRHLRLMRSNHLLNLFADAHHRVQRGHRLLKNHRRFASADYLKFMFAEANQIFADTLAILVL
jgi:hypothetical protein